MFAASSHNRLLEWAFRMGISGRYLEYFIVFRNFIPRRILNAI